MNEGTTFLRSERLRKPSQLRSFLKTASSIRKGGVVLYYLKSENENSRFAVRVGRAAFKRAVDRNRAKRIARECFRISKSRFRGNFDLLVKIEGDSNLFVNNNLQQTLTALLSQSKILSEKEE